MNKHEYYAIILSAGRRANRFHVYFRPVQHEVNKKEARQICSDILWPLLAPADECYVYGQNTDTDTYKRHNDMLVPYRGKFRIEPKQESVIGREEFWGAGSCERGTVVWTAPLRRDLLEELFSKTYNPGFLSNLGVVASKSATKFAKRSVQDSPDRITFLLEENMALKAMHVCIGHRNFDDVLSRAFDLCLWSSRLPPPTLGCGSH